MILEKHKLDLYDKFICNQDEFIYKMQYNIQFQFNKYCKEIDYG